jgi:hypothetical protein
LRSYSVSMVKPEYWHLWHDEANGRSPDETKIARQKGELGIVFHYDAASKADAALKAEKDHPDMRVVDIREIE